MDVWSGQQEPAAGTPDRPQRPWPRPTHMPVRILKILMFNLIKKYNQQRGGINVHVCNFIVTQTSDKHCKVDYRHTENEIVRIRNILREGTSAEGTGDSIRTS